MLSQSWENLAALNIFPIFKLFLSEIFFINLKNIMYLHYTTTVYYPSSSNLPDALTINKLLLTQTKNLEPITNNHKRCSFQQWQSHTLSTASCFVFLLRVFQTNYTTVSSNVVFEDNMDCKLQLATSAALASCLIFSNCYFSPTHTFFFESTVWINNFSVLSQHQNPKQIRQTTTTAIYRCKNIPLKSSSIGLLCTRFTYTKHIHS